MSRSGYMYCVDQWKLIRYRGAVASALRGKRGQRFLNEMATALDVLPESVLGAGDLIDERGDVCALGAVAWLRGMDLCSLDAQDADKVADAFGIAPAMAREIVFENDDGWHIRNERPTTRFHRVRQWVASKIN